MPLLEVSRNLRKNHVIMKPTSTFKTEFGRNDFSSRRGRWIFPLVCGIFVCGILLVRSVDLQAQNIVRRNDGTGDRRRSLFDGLELNPKLLHKLKHKIRISDWSQFEIDAYYEILKHLQNSSASELKKKAAENRLANIELYRKEAQRIHDFELEKYRQQFDAKSLSAERFAKRKRQAEKELKARLLQYKNFQKQPSTFHSFAMLFRSVDEKIPYKYHGKLVTLSGRIQRLISYPARKNRQSIERLYEAWIYTEDSQHNPTVVIMTSKPEGMPEGENIYEYGTVTGIFFKMHIYEDAHGKMRKAPMILAHRLQWKPSAEKETSRWVSGIIVGSVVLILAVTIWLNLQDRRMRKAHRDVAEQQSHLSDLSENQDPRTHLQDLETEDRTNR